MTAAQVTMVTAQLNEGYGPSCWHLSREHGLVGDSREVVARSTAQWLF